MAERPNSRYRSAQHVMFAHKAPESRIVAVGAVVAQYVQRTRRYRDFRKAAAIGITHVRFGQRGTVDVDRTVVDANAIAGQTDDAFDVRFRRRPVMVERDDIAA